MPRNKLLNAKKPKKSLSWNLGGKKKGYYGIVGFPHSSVGKESACTAGDLGSISGSRRSSGEGNGNSLQYSSLENPMDRGAW